jgi:DNA-directed RNA polymerase III subunit RPC6
MNSGESTTKHLTGFEQVNLYRAINQILPNMDAGFGGSGFVRVPCGICPLIDNCHENSPISPHNCIYMKEWLEF